jgi:hypothetical protein
METIDRMIKTLQTHLGNLSNMLNMDTAKIVISQAAILEAIERVEKRRVYYSFRFRELSKEAIMLLFGSLGLA